MVTIAWLLSFLYVVVRVCWVVAREFLCCCYIILSGCQGIAVSLLEKSERLPGHCHVVTKVLTVECSKWLPGSCYAVAKA